MANKQVKEITKKIIEDSDSQAHFVAQVLEARPANQYAVLDALDALSTDAGRKTAGTPTPGDTILYQFKHKLDQYGASTYPLSEKQIAVIVRENWDWASGRNEAIAKEMGY